MWVPQGPHSPSSVISPFTCQLGVPMYQPPVRGSRAGQRAEHGDASEPLETLFPRLHDPDALDDERPLDDLLRRAGDYDRLGWLSVVAHDVRCALAGLTMSAEILADDVDVLQPREVRDLATTVRRQALVLQGVTENLLCLDAIAHGRFGIQPQALPLSEVVRDARDLLGILLTRRQQRLLVRTRGDVPEVWADRRRITQVLINLLSNANKFSGPGTIGVTLSRQGDTVRISVTDRGPGLTAEDRERIFQHFYRGASARSSHAEGSGLGLSIVKAIVEAHGGRVRAQNRRGGGARCWFELPIAVPAVADTAEGRHPALPATSERYVERDATGRPALSTPRPARGSISPRLTSGTLPSSRPRRARAS